MGNLLKTINSRWRTTNYGNVKGGAENERRRQKSGGNVHGWSLKRERVAEARERAGRRRKMSLTIADTVHYKYSVLGVWWWWS
jgi:hypothetical protein